jgi:MFS family permease
MLQLCPALIDWLLFLTMFAILYGAGARGFSPAQWTWLGSLMQLTYLFSSLATGHLLTSRNTRPLLLGSTVMSSLLMAVALWAESFATLAALSAGIGIFAAIFFTAFQTFMRHVAPPDKLHHTAGLYTCSWSIGAGLGFLSAGALYNFGPLALTLLTVLVGGVTLAILLSRHAPAQAVVALEPGAGAAETAHVPESVRRRYIWIGWILIFVVVFALRPVQTFLPPLGAKAGHSALLTTLPLFLQIMLQGLAGYAMHTQTRWLYRRAPLVWLQLGAALIFVALACVPAGALVGLPLIGLWCGYAYFQAVYYSSNAGRRAWNLGINEFLVGVASLCGLFLVEFCMQQVAQPETALYLCAGGCLLVAALAFTLLAPRR